MSRIWSDRGHDWNQEKRILNTECAENAEKKDVSINSLKEPELRNKSELEQMCDVVSDSNLIDRLPCHCDPVEKRGKQSPCFGDCFPAERGISLLAMTF